MKYLVLIGDGMADYPLEVLGGRTPLEAADAPALDALVARGMVGQYCPIPEGMPPGSDVGNLTLFGYNPRETFTGRAPIEAANQGIQLADDEVAFRCNLVTLTDGRMEDFTSGHISTEEAREIIAALNDTLAREFPVKFNTGVSYRHLAVIRGGDAAGVAGLVDAACEPPHNITDREYAPYLPQGGGADLLRTLMDRSREILAAHPVNAARLAGGKRPAVSIWLWGQGKAPVMDTFINKFNRTGAVVSAVDLVKGIGVCAGLEVLHVPGATGWLDTDYAGKVAAALDALNRCDAAYIHVEAPDETAHQGRVDLKIQAIEDYSRFVVGPCLDYCDTHPDTRVFAAPDHFTLISTKTHAGGPVPFGMCGPGIPRDTATAYTEGTAAASGVHIAEGHRLLRSFLCDETVVL